MSDDESATPTQGSPPAPDGWVPPAPPPPRGDWTSPERGDPQPFAASYVPQPGYAYGPPPASSVQPTYQPGLGKLTILPPAESGWNWGAFFFTWIWGLFNGAYVTLWGLLLWIVPLGNIVWAIVCGLHGNRWAWQGRPWASAQEFRSAQHKWAVAALIVFIVALVVPILVVLTILAGGHTSAVRACGALAAGTL